MHRLVLRDYVNPIIDYPRGVDYPARGTVFLVPWRNKRYTEVLRTKFALRLGFVLQSFLIKTALIRLVCAKNTNAGFSESEH